MASRLIKFRVWGRGEFTYSHTKKGKSRLGWFFSNTEGLTREQFTGLFDRKGVEIWENDIVEYYCSETPIVGEILWNEDRSQFGLKLPEDRYAYGMDKNDVSLNVRVVGNIYQNSDLLNLEAA